MKIYVNPNNGIHYANFEGVWLFWGNGRWLVSADANPNNGWHTSWQLVLVGNNFRLK